MKLYTFEVTKQRFLGAAQNGQLIDLSAAYEVMRGLGKAIPEVERLPRDMISFIRGGEPVLAAAREALGFASRRPAMPVGERLTYFFDEATILSPVPRPGKILCAGYNYHGRFTENPELKKPTQPFFFTKVTSSLIGSGQPVILPPSSKEVDYGIELAVVIGRRLKCADEKEVADAVFGYTILNDITARDIQKKELNQLTLSKNFDTFCPVGPCLVTKDEIPDPTLLKLRCYIDDKLRQEALVSDLVFSIPRLLSYLSDRITLDPGDIVSTGSPAGSGAYRKPPAFLQNEDILRSEIEHIGRLDNPVVSQ